MKDHAVAAAAQAHHDDRRVSLRMPVRRDVKLFEPAAGRYFGGCTHDMSTTGLRVELPVSATVLPGRRVNIHIASAGREGQSLAHHRQMLPAQVVWVDRSPPIPGRMTVGLQLLACAVALDAA